MAYGVSQCSYHGFFGHAHGVEGNLEKIKNVITLVKIKLMT